MKKEDKETGRDVDCKEVDTRRRLLRIDATQKIKRKKLAVRTKNANKQREYKERRRRS